MLLMPPCYAITDHPPQPFVRSVPVCHKGAITTLISVNMDGTTDDLMQDVTPLPLHIGEVGEQSEVCRPPSFLHACLETLCPVNNPISQQTPMPQPDQIDALFTSSAANISQWEQTLHQIIPAIVSIRFIAVRNFGVLTSQNVTVAITCTEADARCH